MNGGGVSVMELDLPKYIYMQLW